MARKSRATRAGMLFEQQAALRYEFRVSDGVPLRSACEVTAVESRLLSLQADPSCVWACAGLGGEVLDGWFRLKSGRVVRGVSDRVVWRLTREGFLVACPKWALKSLNRRGFFE